MGRGKFRGVSVRRSGDVVKVQIFTDGMILFKRTVPINDRDKVANLLRDMNAKGVVFPDSDFNWF